MDTNLIFNFKNVPMFVISGLTYIWKKDKVKGFYLIEIKLSEFITYKLKQKMRLKSGKISKYNFYLYSRKYIMWLDITFFMSFSHI